MSNFCSLNYTVLCPKKEIHGDNDTIIIHEKTFDELGPAWDLHATVPVFLGFLVFPLLNFNSTTFFTKFNSLGKYTLLVLFFVYISFLLFSNSEVQFRQKTLQILSS